MSKLSTLADAVASIPFGTGASTVLKVLGLTSCNAFILYDSRCDIGPVVASKTLFSAAIGSHFIPSGLQEA